MQLHRWPVSFSGMRMTTLPTSSSTSSVRFPRRAALPRPQNHAHRIVAASRNGNGNGAGRPQTSKLCFKRHLNALINALRPHCSQYPDSFLDRPVTSSLIAAALQARSKAQITRMSSGTLPLSWFASLRQQLWQVESGMARETRMLQTR